MIRPAEQSDITGMVDVHLSAFQNFFLTFLGPRFLELLYREILIYPDGIAAVYVEDKRIKGLVAGTVAPPNFYKHLLRTRWFQFAWAALGTALRRPVIIPRLLRAFLYPSQTSSQSNVATLMSLAVDPQMQGKGIGQKLVKAFQDEALRRGVRHVNLTTDRLNNDSVNRFYQKLGFHCKRMYITPQGREMNEYEITVE